MATAEISPKEMTTNRRRSAGDMILWYLCGLALVLLVVPIVWIIAGVIIRAVPHFSISSLVQPTVGNGGGMSQAIIGTFTLMVMVAVMAGIAGVGSGIYISQFAPRRVGGILRGAIEVLAGVPSIVAGYVGFIAVAVHFHWGFSIWLAGIALSVIVVPYIAKTTELSMRGVPGSYRDGAEALGMRDVLILRRIMLRAAAPGMVTGLIMALAISIGETAPLLYTAGWSTHNPTFSIHNSPVGYLTYLVWTFYFYPVKSSTYLATTSAMLLILIVVGLIVASRFVSRWFSRYLPPGQG